MTSITIIDSIMAWPDRARGCLQYPALAGA
jgi:hypothetical protein